MQDLSAMELKKFYQKFHKKKKKKKKNTLITLTGKVVSPNDNGAPFKLLFLMKGHVHHYQLGESIAILGHQE